MDKVRVFYDAAGKTLSVWVDDPETEDVCEEVGDDTILMKDAAGRVIGLEKLNVVLKPGSLGLTVEMSTAPDGGT